MTEANLSWDYTRRAEVVRHRVKWKTKLPDELLKKMAEPSWDFFTPDPATSLTGAERNSNYQGVSKKHQAERHIWLGAVDDYLFSLKNEQITAAVTRYRGEEHCEGRQI